LQAAVEEVLYPAGRLRVDLVIGQGLALAFIHFI
jgi:hypothetical protein